MKGDFTRNTFKPERRYSSVRMQQGRVQLDADWNEQADIFAHRIETGAADAIGLQGAPEGNAGFKLDIDADSGPIIRAARDKGNKLVVGRYYVDGILCEIEKDTPFAEQPHYPGAALPTESGYYLAYLDVWQRHVTAVEDPGLREVALNGAATATRTQTVWQVKLTKIPTEKVDPANPGAANLNEVDPSLKIRRAKLQARIAPSSNSAPDPSAPVLIEGLRNAQNQLYRVEIHKPGPTDVNPPTFKWSRDNGSILSAIEKIEGTTITIVEPGKDERLAFAARQWVEIFNDGRELSEEPGILVQLGSTSSGTTLQYDPDTATEPIPELSKDQALAEKWRIRRWDHQAEKAEIPITPGYWVALEDGLQVMFTSARGQYQPGDYWLIPARAATGGQIEWPTENVVNPSTGEVTKEPKELERFGVHHHYSRLAILHLDGSAWSVACDLHKVFSPLSDQISFFYLSGDGQEALPGTMLPKPLQVGVTNGLRPVANAKIQFDVSPNNGTLYADANGTTVLVSPVMSAAAGVAQCYWKLDAGLAQTSQQVRATLLDVAGKPIHLPIHFNANQSVAFKVAYDEPVKCAEGENEPVSVKTLFKKALAEKWPDVDGDQHATVKDVLDAVLCHLHADTLPFRFDPNACKNVLYPKEMEQTVGAALKRLCELMAVHVGYDIPTCIDQNNPPPNPPPTVQSLFATGTTKVPDWPDLDKDQRVTVKDILDGLLCHLDANRLPFQHKCRETDDIFPPKMQSVGEALRALCDLAAQHVSYEVLPCGDKPEESSTVQSLLKEFFKEKWPPKDAAGRTTIKLILDTLLCQFDADKLPFVPPLEEKDCTNKFFATISPKTVGAALRLLCQLSAAHVGYQVPTCGNADNAPPTVQSLFAAAIAGWPQKADSGDKRRRTVNAILEALLCELDADLLPFHLPRRDGRFPKNMEQTASTALDYLSQRIVPAGMIMAFANKIPPEGWLECDGRLIKKADFPDLYKAILGSDDDVGEIRIPELRGEFIRGWISNRNITEVPGEDPNREFGAPQEDAFQKHSHEVASKHSHKYQSHTHAEETVDAQAEIRSAQVAAPAVAIDPIPTTSEESPVSLGGPVQFDNGGEPRAETETRPRNVALMYCIKT